ncbi:MAG: radical SAM protein [Deltaproteobacteria bacterium]|nr:radical SAM protein [Deltaproteobacteria bacterium]MBN2671915.1 radical SAM protein [Deltaproteobacteria bacterium]
MTNSRNSCFAKPYSHIYVEQQIAEAPRAIDILNRFGNAEIVRIDTYKQVFNRPKQQFDLQKKSAKIILAKKQPPYLQPFSNQCQKSEFPNAVYVTPALGCVYDCDFCFLHGMYNSANIVVFVNIDDIQKAICKTHEEQNRTPLWVSISYETDLLALDSLGAAVAPWIAFAHQHPNIFMECRTRSSAFHRIAMHSPPPNFILAWSLSPREHAQKYEHRAPRIEQRLRAAKEAIDMGWKVRLCFDPVLNDTHLSDIFQRLFSDTFAQLDACKLFDVTLGPFRMGNDFFKRIQRARPQCDLFYRKIELEPEPFDRAIVKEIQKYVPREKLVLWQSQS